MLTLTLSGSSCQRQIARDDPRWRETGPHRRRLGRDPDFEPVADENAISFTTSSCSPFILAAPKADPKPTDGEDRSETDDATINKYHVKWDFKWVNGSSGASANYEYKNPVTGESDPNYLFFHPQTWNYQNANLMVELTFSGTQDDSIPAGSIEIRIPVSIFSGWRTGNPADSIVTQVPLAPATNAQSNFNYYVDTETNELVIKNFNMIPATTTSVRNSPIRSARWTSRADIRTRPRPGRLASSILSTA